jgi:lysophospholipase L1-like esterase
MLGDDYEVLNCGVGGTTMLRKGDHPYWHTEAYQKALAANPDIVFIDLGGNDAKAVNRPYYDEMVQDCRDMIRSFKTLPSAPRIILLLPTVFFEKDSMQIWDPVSRHQVAPRLKKAAFEEDVELLDMYPLLTGRPELVPDGIHPEDEGSSLIAKRLYEQVVQPFDRDFDVLKNATLPYRTTEQSGYICVDFKLHGRECKVVKPKTAAPGRPWIWRARFWWHEPQTDIALLERGFHVAYCDVSGLMGNDEALSIWSDFYNLLTAWGLSGKAAMEGMSRGAMYAFSWAAANPDKVSAVYVDNALLDCRYLAEREAGQMIRDFMTAYHLATLDDIRTFTGSPIDKTAQIVAGKYPILVLCADEDEAVPATQTLLFEKKIKEGGGNIRVIMKRGFRHHPHSLPNPAPIVEFVLQATTGSGENNYK